MEYEPILAHYQGFEPFFKLVSGSASGYSSESASNKKSESGSASGDQSNPDADSQHCLELILIRIRQNDADPEWIWSQG